MTKHDNQIDGSAPVLSAAEERRTARAGAINSAAYVVCVLTGVVVMPLISRILPVADLGRAMSFATARDILYVVLSLSALHSVPLAMIKFRNDRGGYLASVFQFTALCQIVLFLIALPFKDALLPLFFGNSLLFYWLFAILLLQCAADLVVSYFHFHNRYVLSVVATLFSYPVPVVLSVVFILAMPSDKYIGRIVGLDSFFFAFGALCAVLLVVRGRLRIKAEHVRYALRVSLPLIPYTLASMVLLRSSVFMITYFSGSASAGIYMMAFTLANLLLACLQQVLNFWSPWVYRRLAERDAAAIKANAGVVAAISFAAACGLMCVMPEAVRLFISAEYFDSIALIAPITVGIFFSVINKLFFDVEYFGGKTKFIALAPAAAALFSIALNLLLIKPFGYEVCALTTAVSYALLTLMHLMYTRRMGVRNIYPIGRILAYSGAVVGVSVAVQLTLDLPLARFALLLAVLCATVIFERPRLAPLLARLMKKA